MNPLKQADPKLNYLVPTLEQMDYIFTYHPNDDDPISTLNLLYTMAASIEDEIC